MTNELEKAKQEFLSYINNIEGNSWFVAFQKLPNDSATYSVMIKNSALEKSMKEPNWDLCIGEGLPSCMRYGYGDDSVVTYHKYGKPDLQPLVYYRSFENIRPSYIEISEEFRLYHNLFYDIKSNKYIKIDDNGDEEEIIIVEPDNTVKIKLKALKQFLAIKAMSLLFLFDYFYYSKNTLEELGQTKVYATTEMEDDLIYNYAFCNVDWSSSKGKSYISIIGKKLIKGYPKEKCGIWPYNEVEDEIFDDFIIGIDENGEEITHSSDPEKLDNYFDKNPGSPHYLTPVFFKKDVLNKYYNNPDKYTVSDGYISCGGLWGLKIDNDKKENVAVFLGDLGRYLSHTERLYWKSFNVPPDGSGISETCWQRSFNGEFCNPIVADLKFKQLFQVFNESWKEKYGWDLFLPLTKDDEYHYKKLHIPSNNQSDFDEQIRGLVKIIIDSINEKELNKLIPTCDGKSITKLEQFLKVNNKVNYEVHIAFLKDLQNLRSSAIAHRKGGNYEKIAKTFEIENKLYSNIFENILNSLIELLGYLEANFLS